MRKFTILAAILTLTLSFSRRGEANDVRQVAERSAAAVDAGTPEAALQGIDTAWQGNVSPSLPVYGGEGHKTLPAFTAPLPPSLETNRAEDEGIKNFAERRKAIQQKRAPGKFLRALGYGTAGFVAGAVLGWAAGAFGGGALVMKAPNPRIHKWRYALVVPAAVVGLVVGAIVMPFLLAYVFSKARPYDAKGVPDRQGVD